MKINMQSVGFTASTQLMEFTEQKVSKLARFDDDISGAEVYFKLEKSIEIRKVAEIRLKVPGDDLFASKASVTFEEAVDDCIAALRKQLEKRKGKSRG